MDERKFCPIMTNGGYMHDCIGKECAWWCEFARDCAVPLAAGILADSSVCQNTWGELCEEVPW